MGISRVARMQNSLYNDMTSKMIKFFRKIFAFDSGVKEYKDKPIETPATLTRTAIDIEAIKPFSITVEKLSDDLWIKFSRFGPDNTVQNFFYTYTVADHIHFMEQFRKYINKTQQ